MTISLKENAAGTQGEILLNCTLVQAFNKNTLSHLIKKAKYG